ACGMSAHAGVLEALLRRALTGRGSALEVSLFDAVADWMNVPLLYFEGTGSAPQRVGLAHPSICPYGAFATRDGHLVLISIQNEREWASFCAGILRAPELPQRPGWESNTARVANRPEVDGRVAAAFAVLDRDGAAARLRAARIAYGFVNDLAGLAAHPAIRRTSVTTERGTASVVAPPVIRDGAAPRLGPVPAVGADDDIIRRDFQLEPALVPPQ
ncbi:MAG: CoA transferase, partial [Pseudomonadota bacterium]|nr:CoA transferase [Pseudomonadota bacterium]